MVHLLAVDQTHRGGFFFPWILQIQIYLVLVLFQVWVVALGYLQTSSSARIPFISGPLEGQEQEGTSAENHRSRLFWQPASLYSSENLSQEKDDVLKRPEIAASVSSVPRKYDVGGLEGFLYELSASVWWYFKEIHPQLLCGPGLGSPYMQRSQVQEMRMY